MIPIITMNDAGELSYQIFNDNLSPVEQINRKILMALVYAQTKLVNDKEVFDRKVGSVEYTDEKITAINTAADTLVKDIEDAIKTFAETL